MVGHGSASRSPLLSGVNHDMEAFRKSAGKCVPFPKSCLPPPDDFRAACADLIWRTFRKGSVNANAIEAARTVGGSPDTFARIMDPVGTTRIDFRLMVGVMRIASDRNIPIPHELAVRT